ncbi:MAG: mechanosensitive ion channel family protein [Proteobacteria bacterium]|nr:mechanosensitive ion channel family protein [Pseudomonadota bacterium]
MLLALGVLLNVVTPSSSFAQTAPLPPAGLSQQQFDALVDAIGKSVAEKLKADQKPAAESTVPRTTTAATAETAIARSLSGGPDDVSLLLRHAGEVVVAVPGIIRELRHIYGLLDQRDSGGLGSANFLTLLMVVAILSVAVEALARRMLRAVQFKLAKRAAPELGLRSLLPLVLLAATDALCVGVMWAASRAGAAFIIAGSPSQHRLATAILLGIAGWRLLALLFRIVLRPDLRQARLCDVEDRLALSLYRRFTAVALLLIVFRMQGQLMAAVGTSPLILAAWQAILVPGWVALLLWLVIGTREAMRQWLVGLGQTAALAAFVGRHWVSITATFFVAAGATQLHGIASGRLHVGNAVLTTFDVAVALLLFETLMQAVVRRLDSQLEGYTSASTTPKLPDVVARCLRVGVLIVAAAVVAENWVVHVLGLIGEAQWAALTRSTRTASISLFAAFVAWELFKFVTDPYVLGSPAAAARGGAGSPATRLHTMMGLLRATVAILLFVIAGLVALDDIGVNVAPLIAGASVFGIAISFGSQALVKDIVSGIFYLYDDAFRVGEYIDCGRAKGTVEGFTLRSVRLRHQDGQVHTIPFGDLGQITNFSRDWTTCKFTLRLARDTDPDRLRKVTKEIGTEMLETSDVKDEIIEPLKMQGIEEVADNALIVRFKFVARPGNSNAVQNDAVSRLLKVFPERGIEFAR